MSYAVQGKRVMAALKKITKASKGSSINELRMIVALERAVARIEMHPKLSPHIIFKGGFVLMKTIDTLRFTHDVDALAVGLTRSKIPELVNHALKLDLDDGLWFGDLKVTELTDQGEYGGYRLNCAFQIGEPPAEGDSKTKKLSRIHIDIGFGDAVEFVQKKQIMNSILSDSKPVSWSVYPFEYIFAEKLEALFSRGSANSRAKDIYDMPLIFSKCKDKKALLQAVIHTFTHRETKVPDSFETQAKTIDLFTMRNAWRSVELSEDTYTFDGVWNELLAALRVIDLIRK